MIRPFGTWLDRRRALAELKRALQAERNVTALDDANPLNRAKIALQVDDRAAARHYFDLAKARIPAFLRTTPDTIEVMLGLEAYDEAEDFIAEGMRLFPREAYLAEGFALVAERRADLETAITRWAMVRKRFPSRPLAYVQGAGCLRRLGRFAEADAVIRRAMALMPDDVAVRLEYGRIGEASGDWTDAYRRWAEISDRHPAGLTGMAEALHRQGKDAEAEALLEKSRMIWPLEAGMRALYARIAAEAGRIDEAAERWAVVRDRFPRDQIGYTEGLTLLRAHLRWEEADAVATEAVRQFPDRTWPHLEYAMLAHARRDWPAAAVRWAAVREALPDEPIGYQRGIEALEASGDTDAANRLRAAYNDKFLAKASTDL